LNRVVGDRQEVAELHTRTLLAVVVVFHCGILFEDEVIGSKVTASNLSHCDETHADVVHAAEGVYIITSASAHTHTHTHTQTHTHTDNREIRCAVASV
jgi:hypothetical protein